MRAHRQLPGSWCQAPERHARRRAHAHARTCSAPTRSPPRRRTRAPPPPRCRPARRTRPARSGPRRRCPPPAAPPIATAPAPCPRPGRPRRTAPQPTRCGKGDTDREMAWLSETQELWFGNLGAWDRVEDLFRGARCLRAQCAAAVCCLQAHGKHMGYDSPSRTRHLAASAPPPPHLLLRPHGVVRLGGCGAHGRSAERPAARQRRRPPRLAHRRAQR